MKFDIIKLADKLVEKTLKLNVNYYKVILKHCKPKEKSRYRYLLKTHL